MSRDDVDALDRLVEVLRLVLYDARARRRVIGRLRPVLTGGPHRRPLLRLRVGVHLRYPRAGWWRRCTPERLPGLIVNAR